MLESLAEVMGMVLGHIAEKTARSGVEVRFIAMECHSGLPGLASPKDSHNLGRDNDSHGKSSLTSLAASTFAGELRSGRSCDKREITDMS